MKKFFLVGELSRLVSQLKLLKVIEVFKSVLKRLKGVENVYTQRNPQLIETVELLLKGKLKEIRHVSITLKYTKLPEYKEAKPGSMANSTSQTGDTSSGDGSGFNLQLGLCSNNGGTVGLGTLNNNNVANGFEEFGDAAVDGVCNLLGRVRKGIVRGF
ncbi:hypothetical protein PSTG_07067 [Puccinia striiformis f. sp. tritici PST-78]|uniref:Uncharacterized protein n=1 Tax=Puccinia striiformis f. sp. tritici PST-78 TaxID=1165861 RepID=A0A0L0VKH3_9BASI|nr:hypothetical protein PSTG_07067 [Puccinia striiformis f. sp. tritici PST-78]